jgi:signal transduction histidine kinase/DNA-binding response OmpR family regulator
MQKSISIYALIFLIALLGAVSAVAQYTKQDSIDYQSRLTVAYDYAWNKPDTGLIVAEQFIEEARAINYIYGEAHAYIFKADCYMSMGDYARTIYNLLAARDICTKRGITTLNQRINRPFGELYIELGQPKKAVEHQLKALSQSTEETESVIVTKGLADAYLASGQPDSALYYAKPIFEKAGKFWGALGVSLGRIYTHMGRFDDALKAFRTKAGLTFDLDRVNNYYGLAILFDSLRVVDSTRYYANQTLQLAQEKNFFKFINESGTLLAASYEKENREQYIRYLQMSYTARDSLYSREKMNQINNYIFADETRKRELAVAEQQFIDQRKTIFLVALSLILLISGLLLWRNNYIKTKSNTQLREQKQKIESTLIELRTTQSKLIEAEKTARELETQEAERLRDLDQLKTRLYTNITHEFRTPLTVIMGMNDNIQGHKKEKSLIRRNANNLLRLINQLLDLSKLDSGSLKLEHIQGNIVAFLQYLTESFYSMASDKRVVLNFRSETDSLIMDFDQDKIQHIIYNLLSNAIKFTRPGGKVVLEVENAIKDKDDQIKVIVKDTGSGIPPEELPFIFDRFYQAKGYSKDLNTSQSFSGTGIGLAFAKELVELMKGTIEVKSEVGWGTTFTIMLPIRKKETTRSVNFAFSDSEQKKEFAPSLQQIAPTPDQIPGGKPSVLIIEDNSGVSSYIKSLLEKDYYIQEAINGQEGIDIALEYIPDLIITDVMMPEKNGYEVCQTLKNDLRTSHIPIVMLTAKADFDSKIEGLEKGADAYLFKPFEKDELLVRLRKLLQLRKQLQELYSKGIINIEIPEKASALENKFLEDITNLIEEQLENSNLTVPDICQAMQLSHTQLYRKLKAVTGRTPSQFIRRIRLHKAKHLLIHSKLNVSEVAYEVGFNDPNYFSRMFKKEFGNSPGELSEQMQ